MTAALVLCSALLFSSCGALRSAMTGDRNVLPRSYELTDGAYRISVSDISNESGTDLRFTVDETRKDELVITTDDNIFTTLKVEVDRETREISISGDSKKRYAPSEFEISLGVPVSAVTLSGGYDVEMLLPTSKELALTVSGAIDGEITLENASSLTVDISGAAELELAGRAADFTVKASGAAEISAYKLRTETAAVNVAGAAELELFVAETLDATVDGAANVYYKGDPKTVRPTVRGLGVIAPASDGDKKD